MNSNENMTMILMKDQKEQHWRSEAKSDLLTIMQRLIPCYLIAIIARKKVIWKEIV